MKGLPDACQYPEYLKRRNTRSDEMLEHDRWAAALEPSKPARRPAGENDLPGARIPDARKLP
jgi:hypothetical protein